MSLFTQLTSIPKALLETSNILLTTEDAVIGATPKDVVWTHRKTTLYRYRSSQRRHPVPVLLVFALINRPMIYDLRPGNSFVEFLLEEGYDVFLLDWGAPDDEDTDMGLANYVCDELNWAVRETCRASGSPDISIIGWCIGAALSAMYGSLYPDGPARNLVLLTMPIDPSDSLYTTWVGRDSFDVDQLVDDMGNIPGRIIDTANKLLKPVTNFVTTRRSLFEQVQAGSVNRPAYQSMSKWVGDNPPFPAQAFREWITWMYKENRLVRGRIELRGRRVDLRNIAASCLVVTAGSDHIAPRHTTTPFLDLVGSDDVEHMARPGGHIGLMAGSKAKREVWPEISAWLEPRSGTDPYEP
ncbi:polyhydroxyalkanoate synthase [Kineosphaera limosa]|uniref:Putative hydrolase n=1 Tax=Kineosphaera limosa NBRC 100340 TaxID=1184609 RepID=K6WS50_9MICO|nr:alpha/beta fold hydrolase [Kineosphaera limosa]NYE01519.1 polyhydroxyalkanoate synthase [Kineosphaera limosa]GAB96676.1 putative hydrolase [Kineosphaera limosa NBRC 100340]